MWGSGMGMMGGWGGGMDAWGGMGGGYGAMALMNGGGKGKGKGKGGSGKGKGSGGINGNVGVDNATKIFVGGLPQGVMQEEVEAYFGNFGSVKNVEVKTDPMTGKSRGFAFVTFSDEASMEAAISAYDSHELRGKWIECKKATAGGSTGAGGKGKGGSASSEKLFVGGLAKTSEESTINEFFGQFGTVTACEVKRDTETGSSRGFAFVTMSTSAEANAAIANFGNNYIDGKWVEVKAAVDGGSKGASKGKGKGKGKSGKGGMMNGGWGGMGGGMGGYGSWGGMSSMGGGWGGMGAWGRSTPY